jgi:hypothetical protein
MNWPIAGGRIKHLSGVNKIIKAPLGNFSR